MSEVFGVGSTGLGKVKSLISDYEDKQTRVSSSGTDCHVIHSVSRKMKIVVILYACHCHCYCKTSASHSYLCITLRFNEVHERSEVEEGCRLYFAKLL